MLRLWTHEVHIPDDLEWFHQHVGRSHRFLSQELCRTEHREPRAVWQVVCFHSERSSTAGGATQEMVTLRPGDLVATLTPAGVGTARVPPIYLKLGDRTACTVEGIGTLRNTVEVLGAGS